MHIQYTRIIAAVVLRLTILVLRASRLHGFADPESALTVQSLSSPAGANSSEPQLTVQGYRAILRWLEVTGERATLKFAVRTSSGWATPQTVASGNNFFVN